jgi:hypothetical protein
VVPVFLRRAPPADYIETNAGPFEAPGWYTCAMCVRYTHPLTWRQIVELYGLLDADGNPSQEMLALTV